MANPDRPLSPHLQVYRWHLTMTTSILHRMTGVVAALGAVLFVWWLLAVATGPQAFATVQAFYDAWYGRFILFGVSWAICYHLLNGIRHLFWDVGKGFGLETAYRSGIAVIFLSLVLVIGLWAYGYWALGVWS